MPNSVDLDQISEFVEKWWDKSVLPSLCEFVEIPALSPSFDSDWEANGYLDAAINTFITWTRSLPLNGLSLSVHRLKNRSPLLLVKIDGDTDGEVLFYSHLDKQPEASGWSEGKGPWKPVIEDGWLFGRGSVDDGYGGYAGVLSILALQDQGVSHPTCRFLIETGEESGSPDLSFYLDELESVLGVPELVIVLDTGGIDYDRLWVTESLRGIVAGTLSVKVSSVGVHSGHGSGIMPSSFRLARQLLSRIEDENTGEIKPEWLHIEITDKMKEQAKKIVEMNSESVDDFPLLKGVEKQVENPLDIFLTMNLSPSLSIIGADGIPSIQDAGNVLRTNTDLKISIRTPPGINAEEVAIKVQKLLEENPPNGAHISAEMTEVADGFLSPDLPDELAEMLDVAGEKFYGNRPMSLFIGGTIPVMAMLQSRYPDSKFIITGAGGPGGNAHGPDEKLHIPTAKKVTKCMAAAVSAAIR
ncbi:MAG: peptidase M20 [Methanobacteriota archaeon]|jgi:acetylornithine deacetylase/succinyl-diaminopimelate desuccinylase-like protein|uniref:M20/M25/M40 family metallo-hydrolase n=1 Tax=Marine Group III euryarchaeote TaxID=2173149 RepID=A0A7J4GTI8_9ARCH|nr:MAG: peptidase M20 [Euryarchaeota archaeon]HIF36840.1 M20/M25/M40 family metallo-hydrolase [Marine Group III euryarchaeote]